MSKEIWKYTLGPGETTFDIPCGSSFMSVQMQHGHAQLWALVDPENPKAQRSVIVVGTGHPIDYTGQALTFIDTFQLEGGSLVFHAFEVDQESRVLMIEAGGG